VTRKKIGAERKHSRGANEVGETIVQLKHKLGLKEWRKVGEKRKNDRDPITRKRPDSKGTS